MKVLTFWKTESVANKNQNVENPVVRTEIVEMTVLGHVAIDFTISTTTLAAVSTINCTSGLTKHKFDPYNIQLVQNLMKTTVIAV